MDFLEIKVQVQQACKTYVQMRVQTALNAIASVQASAEEDTKSSAGDKYETGREMMKQELDRNQRLLMEAKQMEQALENVFLLKKPQTSATMIAPGSFVQTDQGWFYLSVGIGKLIVADLEVFVLSPTAPVGKLFMGKKKGEQFTFNQKTYRIEEVW